ncbi:Type IV pilus biogenesis and competence protein PilQ precursor [Rosistilla ulvae]|uniref:Type IV pilus biogenesis and competence protein PilQ n=1 Tax=Rosistilla ulvae TaxID=1930277 RepID=A0A517LXH4_9BACT|nr:protein transporter [Rosistilla ulvae]QDS87328.1 Type IV pilus biogenesis and competence protein PilQ precursor [Rosistilla ulvae]
MIRIRYPVKALCANAWARQIALSMIIGLLTLLSGCQTTPSTPQRSLDEILLETLRVANKPGALSTPNRLPNPKSSLHADTSDEFSSFIRRVTHVSQVAMSPLVDEIFEETDIREAIQSLAAQAKANVVIDDQVTGVATAVFEGVPFEQALEQILMPLGFIWGMRNGQYLVGTSDPSSALFRYLSVKMDYQPRHYAPDDLLPLLPENLQHYVRNVGKRNLMVIHAPQELTDEIIRELQNADQPQPQVILEAMVTVHSPDTSYQFGMDLTQILADGSSRGINAGLSGLALSGTLSPGSIGDLFGNFGTTAYFLRCLEQEGYLDITASPRVMAKNGEEAQISINRETFFSTQVGNSDVFYRQDIEKVESGIVLEITPVIRGDMVTVTIKRAEVSEDIRETGSDPDLASPYPLINRRFVTTTVDVRDGETITIGGLTHRQMIDRESRVPFLGSLPLVGKMFRQIDRQNEEAEVTVFISPRIVYPDAYGEVRVLQTPQSTDNLQAVAPAR